MRLFVAMLFNDDFVKALTDTMSDMRRLGISGNYTRSESLHLTLAFLGETEKISEAKEALSELELSPVTLTLEGTGRFGDLIWAGIKPVPALMNSAKAVSDSLSGKGFILENRQFKPHVTLVRRASFTVLPKAHTASMTVHRISLMKSDLSGRKPSYTEIFSRSLSV